MRISDWSSDVCSSDLAAGVVAVAQRRVVTIACGPLPVAGDRRVFLLPRGRLLAFASCGLLRLPGFLRLGRQARFALLALALQQPLEVVDLLARRRLARAGVGLVRSEEHTSELQSLMRTSYAVFCLKKQNTRHQI